ncbi:MAG: hypothetical protein ACRD45_08370 [Bryobacteraceae bacterium]
MVKTSLVLAGLASVFLLPASSQCSTLFSENFNELTPSLAATSVGGFSAINGSASAMVPEPEGWGLMLLAFAVVGGGRLLQKKFTGRP